MNRVSKSEINDIHFPPTKFFVKLNLESPDSAFWYTGKSLISFQLDMASFRPA